MCSVFGQSVHMNAKIASGSWESMVMRAMDAMSSASAGKMLIGSPEGMGTARGISIANELMRRDALKFYGDLRIYVGLHWDQ